MDSPYAQWATTPQQLEYLNAWEAAGRCAASAARKLGRSRESIRDAILRIKKKAARAGYSPEHDYTRPVPDGFKAKGVSTLYDGAGEVRAQWVKSTADQERQAAILKEAYEGLADELPRVKASKGPKKTNEDLANLYVLADAHFGMLSWPDETGEEYNLDIAENLFLDAVNYLIKNSPRAETGIIANLGDLLHYDSLESVTPASKNILDADSRFPKVARTAVRTLRTMVAAALRRHAKVVLLLSEGNHDPVSSVWLRCMFAALYENEPRVTVIEQERPYYQIQHGKTFLGFHHGHLTGIRGKAGAELALLFASTREWANTHGGQRHIHTAHKHHAEELDVQGARLIQHPTLAAKDAYAARHGYLSGRELRSITYHSEFGETGRVSVTPQMLK